MAEAARGAQCNRSHAYAMRRTPGFEDELHRLQQEAVQRFATELPSLAESATTALKHVLDSNWVAARTRVEAARLVVELMAVVAATQPDETAPIDLKPVPPIEPEGTA